MKKDRPSRSYAEIDKKGVVHVYFKATGGYHEFLKPTSLKETEFLDKALKKSFSKKKTKL